MTKFFKTSMLFVMVAMLLCAFIAPAQSAWREDLEVTKLKVRDLTVTGSSAVAGMASVASGNTWYVDSGRVVAGDGKTWATAFVTLVQADNAATASNGDVVYVAAGHAESIIAAGTITLDKAGVTYIGLGFGNLRPTLTWSTNVLADMEIDAADIVMANFIFDLTGIDTVAAAIDVDAAGFQLYGCKIILADAGGQCTLGMQLDANADRLVIDGCEWVGSTDTGVTAAISAVATTPDDIVIRNSTFVGDFASAAIHGSAAITNMLLENLYVRNFNDGDHAIELSGNATGVIRNCHLATDAIATAIDPGTLEIFNVLWYDDDHPADAVAVDVLAWSDSDLGLDALMDALYGADGVATYPASAAPGNGVSLAEVLSIIYDAQQGTAGIASYPAAAAPANTVSMAEVLRDIWDAVRNGTGGSEPGTNLSIVDVAKGAGTLVTTSAITSSSIPNNTQVAGAITGAASGALMLEEIIVQCNATGWATPTNIEFSTDNASGLTGAAAPFVLEVIASFGANLTMIASKDGTTKVLPIVLETGKKIFIHGDDAAGTGAGICNVYMKWKPLSDGATIAGANLP